jgi:hypothetical protein
MAKIIKKKVSWNPSSATDVVSYRLYWSTESSGAPDYSSDYKEVDSSVTQVIIPDETPTFPIAIEDNYILGVSSVDDVGNESDIAMAAAVPFDFNAPDAPSDISITDA